MDQKIASMVHADGPCAHIGGGTVGFAGMRPTDAFPSRSSAFLRSVALMMTHHRTSKKKECRFSMSLRPRASKEPRVAQLVIERFDSVFHF
jgi:hypothetical protein